MHQLSVISWNVACSKYDAKHTPLEKRLPALRDLLVATVVQRKADVVLLQEVRNTGDISADDVKIYIKGGLGPKWAAVLVSMDGRPDGFYLALLWNTATCEQGALVEHDVPDTPSGERLRRWFAAHFHVLSDDMPHAPHTYRAEIVVLNTHAPTGIASIGVKESYWGHIFKSIDKNTVCFGDMNKFPRHMDSYNTRLDEHDLVDHVKPDQLTFHSFDHDRKPDGEPYVDSLDAVITKHDSAVRVLDVYIVSTVVKQESDHYIVCATLEFE